MGTGSLIGRNFDECARVQVRFNHEPWCLNESHAVEATLDVRIDVANCNSAGHANFRYMTVASEVEVAIPSVLTRK